MASKQEQTFPLRLLVDKERNQVVIAEASRDFIDTLFSFLTLPLGTIVRLVSNKQQHDQPAEIGCINNLYHSVQNSSAGVFWNPTCKQMLLRPRNNCEALCQKLKLNVDDTEPLRYFKCSSKCRSVLSTFAGASCRSCGKLMDKELKLLEDSREKTDGDGVFVKGEAMYLVFDDLKVLQSSPRNLVKELVQLGYSDFNKLTEMSQNVGLKEILDLLSQALTSNSALNNVFLANRLSKGMYTFSPKMGQSTSYYNIKVTVKKSKKKILHAEAEEDFVDFLFSFLTAPLGSIIKLFYGNSSLGCVDNLYKSVKEFNLSWLTECSRLGTALLDPQVAPQFGFGRLPVQLGEQSYTSTYLGKDDNGNLVISKDYRLLNSPFTTTLFDPRSPDGKSNVGFVRRPSLFVVWDDLQVTPLTNTSSISLMQKLNVPLDDLEEHVLSIGSVEALNLLGASLTSKAALTDGLSYLLKKPDKDAKA